MIPQKYYNPLAKTVKTENASQRIIVNQLTHHLSVSLFERTLFLNSNNDQRTKQQYSHKKYRSVLVEIVREIIMIQTARRIIKNDRLPLCFRKSGNTLIQACYSFTSFRRIQSSCTKVHREHGRWLNCQIRIGWFLQYITPHIGVMQQSVDLSCTKCFHALIHGIIQNDLDSREHL